MKKDEENDMGKITYIDVDFEDVGKEAMFPDKPEYAQCGINVEDFDGTIPTGKLMVYQEMITGCPENKHQDAYVRELKKHNIMDNFLDPDEDGRVAGYVQKFLKAEFGTPNGELVTFNLQYYCNKLVKKFKKFVTGEKSISEYFPQNPWTAKKDSNINESDIRQACWFAVHSYLTGLFICPENIFNILDLISDYQDYTNIWNRAITEMDIPNDVRALFYIPEDTTGIDGQNPIGFCAWFDNTQEEQPAKGLAPHIEDDGHPEDDPPEEDSEQKNNPEPAKQEEIIHEPTKQKEVIPEPDKQEEVIPESAKHEPKVVNLESDNPNKSLDAEYKEAVKRDDDKDKKKDKNVHENKTSNLVKVPTTNPTPLVNIPEQDAIMQTSTPLVSSHDIEISVRGLSNLNALIGDFGYNVVYYPEDPTPEKKLNYPGLIFGLVYKNDISGPIEMILIDPYILYGDTVRIIPDAYCSDIRHAPAIPIYDQIHILKAIIGHFDKDDYDAVMKDIPAPFKEETKDGGYDFLDRIDLRYFKDKDFSGYPYKYWSSIIEKADHVLKDPNVPKKVRFSLIPFGENDFNLEASLSCKSSFYTKIFNEPNHQKAVEEGLTIRYNGKKNNNGKPYIISKGKK